MRIPIILFRCTLFVALVGLGLRAKGQLPDPRIRIRVIDENGGSNTLVPELSNNVYVDEIGSTVKSQLDRTEQLLESGHPAEALDMLMRLLESDHHKLTKASELRAGVIRYLPLSQHIEKLADRLAEESSTAFARFQDQIDPLASQWMDEAESAQNDRLLLRILDETPTSRERMRALLQLGDLALERGHFDAARRYYRRLHSVFSWQLSPGRRLPFWIRVKRGEVPTALVRQVLKALAAARDSETDLDYVRKGWARMTLVSILEGNRDRASTELAMMKRAWPDATGRVGGIEGNYYEKLTDLLKGSDSSSELPVKSSLHEVATDWPTFAGLESRNKTGSVDIDIPLEPAWRIPLKSVTPSDTAIRRRYQLPLDASGELPDQPCSYFPIVIGDTVLIKDDLWMSAFNVETGKPNWSRRDDGGFFFNRDYVRSSSVSFDNPSRNSVHLGNRAHLGQFRFLMSSAEGIAVTTFGATQGGGSVRDTALVGFDLGRQGAIRFGPVLTESAEWSFHGAPINDGNRCWVGMRYSGNATQDYLVCYDVTSGTKLWGTRICSAESIGHGSIQSTNNFVLAKHEDTLYFSSHLGTVAAVHAQTGSIRWLIRYPRRGPKQENPRHPGWYATRELTPCLTHNDLVIVAPSDTDRVLALHQDDGTLIWSTTLPSDATQLLGVSQADQLILAGRRIWWLDAYTGEKYDKADVNPFPSEATSEPKGVGRGLLSGGNVYWPAVEDGESKIYVFDQQSGIQQRQPIDLSTAEVTAGNLIMTHRHLLIASARELVAFVLTD